MSYNNFYKKWYSLSKKFYPSCEIDSNFLKKTISPFQITIPKTTLSKIKQAVQHIFQWSRSNITHPPQISHYSVLMAYDFHFTTEGQPQLIEINTNGSGFLVVDLIDKIHGKHTPALELLKNSFFQEWSLFSKNKDKAPNVVVLDENIEKQNMKFEFQMYQDLIRSWGWNCTILDVSDIQSDNNGRLFFKNTPIDFVYNRLTDFYFEKYPMLKQAYTKQTVCFSPNPQEYALLGDKINLYQLYKETSQNSSSSLQPIQNIILKTVIQNQSSWAERKKLFFKPLTGYGGKSAYRGSSISKTKFNKLSDCIAQEYSPPFKWIDPNTHTEWKMDIRVYVYKDTIQLIGGRIYQGQVTNFKNLYGGFCSIQQPTPYHKELNLL